MRGGEFVDYQLVASLDEDFIYHSQEFKVSLKNCKHRNLTYKLLDDDDIVYIKHNLQSKITKKYTPKIC